MAFSLCACSDSTYGVRAIETLESQDYSMAFRNNDPLYFYVTGAIKVLGAQGVIDELAIKWFGTKAISFEKDATALDEIGMPEPGKTLIIGVDINSFPFAYISNDSFWGFDIELAQTVTEFLEWNLKAQSIEKENVFSELASGNIDCVWGGVALSEKELDDELYTQFGPYIHNDIVIASRDGAIVGSLKGKTLSMPSTPEARQALETIPNEVKKLKNVIRLVGGTTDCFSSLYAGTCDLILTDTCAIQYFNCH